MFWTGYASKCPDAIGLVRNVCAGLVCLGDVAAESTPRFCPYPVWTTDTMTRNQSRHGSTNTIENSRQAPLGGDAGQAQNNETRPCLASRKTARQRGDSHASDETENSRRRRSPMSKATATIAGTARRIAIPPSSKLPV